MTSLDPQQRLDELLDLDALTGLGGEESAELELLTKRLTPASLEAQRFERERAAAALYLALASRRAPQKPP
jgi:hypothetical protein